MSDRSGEERTLFNPDANKWGGFGGRRASTPWLLMRAVISTTWLTFSIAIKPNFLTVNPSVLCHDFTEAWYANQNISKGKTHTHIQSQHIPSKWRKIWAFYNKHISQWLSFSQSNYFTSPEDYWLHHTEKPREACFLFPIYLRFLCKLILVTMKNDKFAIWSKC